jgi:glycosyltransferase involved in cell wall biosynthesis
MKAKVSVIMAVLNGERYIDEAIQSVADQTYRAVELVVIDDGSSDGTVGRIQGFRDKLDIVYVRHEQSFGIARSMNDGLRHATGDLIAFLDHDDAWLPEFLDTQVGHLERHPGVGLVHCDFQTMDGDGHIIEESVAASRGRRRPSGRVFPQLFMDSFIVGNSVVIRRECFTRLGFFDESLKWADYHMWLRIARHYKVDYTDRVLTKDRQHATQSTRNAVAKRPDSPPQGFEAIERILEEYPEVREELGARAIRRRIASFFFDMAYGWFSKGELANARLCGRRALRLWPSNPRYLALYAASCLGPSQARVAKRTWRRLRGQAEFVGVRGITR